MCWLLLGLEPRASQAAHVLRCLAVYSVPLPDLGGKGDWATPCGARATPGMVLGDHGTEIKLGLAAYLQGGRHSPRAYSLPGAITLMGQGLLPSGHSVMSSGSLSLPLCSSH